MLPGTIPLIYSKGHPLFFYFLSSLWITWIAGSSTILVRLFPLLIAIASLFIFHRFAKRHTNTPLANISVLILSLQPMFLAQASLILPEILLFALFTLCFDSYLSGNYRQYALWGSLMMLTKETGAVFILVFGLSFLIENRQAWKSKKFFINLLFLGIPALTYSVFLFLHYLKFDVFFFSEHLDLISTDSSTVLYKLKSASSVLFTRNAHNLLVLPALGGVIYLLFKKKKLHNLRLLAISLAILLAFLTFTILNFYTYRYIFPVIGILLLSSLVIINQISRQHSWIMIGYAGVVLAVTAWYAATKRGQSDADLGYVQFLKVHKQMVEYCEQQNWYDKEFGAGYNMVMGMRDQFSCYLNTTKNFKMHHLPGIQDRDFIIYDSTCWPFEIREEDKSKLKLIKHFQYKKHWGEIYQVEK